MLHFKDLNTRLADGRFPLHEVAKEVLRQECAKNSPNLLPHLEAYLSGLPYRVIAQKGKKPRGKEWRVEIKNGSMQFPFYVVITENWTVAYVRDGWDALFIPSALPVYRMLEEMGFIVA